MAGRPVVSYVVPARDEEAYLPAALASVRALETARPYEVIVISQRGTGVAGARHEGARSADGRWLAFVDADTVVRPAHLDAMVEFVECEGLVAASSRCRVVGPVRSRLPEWIVNYAFPRLRRPVLPGFNFFVERAAYFAHGGFPDVPNEDVAFSRRLARSEPTGYCPWVLVATSGRRIARSGLTSTLFHYVRSEFERVRAASRPVGSAERASGDD